jgi:glycosyltransferase involved in cell wall biosynthesis
VLIENGNLRVFAEAIEKLMHDPSLRERLGKRGQSRIKEVLNWENSSRELMRAYELVLRDV